MAPACGVWPGLWTRREAVEVGQGRPGLVLAAALVIMPSLGALYAWSVLVEPLELRYALTRGQTSLVFSVATVSFTAAMLLAPRLYARLPPPALSLLVMSLAAAGLAVAAAGDGLAVLLLGFGGLFGVANGIGYSLSLQAVHTAVARRRGFATGLVVAAYAAGAALFAPLFAWGVRGVGIGTTLAGAAAFMLAAGIAAAVLLGRAGVRIDAARTGLALRGDGGAAFRWLWLGFFAGSATGVMAIGHAATIASAYGAAAEGLVAAAILVALGNGGGRLAGGWLGDRMPPHRALAAMQTLLAAALVLPLALSSVPAVLAALLLVGIAYGATASLYPIAVSVQYGGASLGRIYGRLFTAWGAAGLVAPWLGGLLFDWTGGYAAAISLGVGAAAFAVVTSLRLPDR